MPTVRSTRPAIPQIEPPATPSDADTWLDQRPDVRLLTAQVQAADRVVRDAWKDWLPTATAAFSPQYVTPAGFFEPANTWRAFVLVQVPIYDGTLSATKRLRIADRDIAQLRLDAREGPGALRGPRRPGGGHAPPSGSWARHREAAENAREALRITEIAYKAGATTNIEVVQAQQAARNAEILEAVAEDRLRQARLDLLVALGQFP